ncbi:MAG: hypothetical protein J0M29_05830 [Chitinophagales bacterium]|nr:hypothetical protein [Chitinophagales bacterium]
MNRAITPTAFSVPAVLLLFLITFQSAGWLMAWQCMHWNVRLEARRILFAGEDLPERSFSKNYFDGIRVGRKEIRLDGHLYDYRKVSETADSIRVALYHDRHEEALFSTLDQLFQTGGFNGKSTVPALIKWLAQSLGACYMPPGDIILPFSSTLAFSRPVFLTYSWGAQFAPGVFAPPPESGRG